MKKVEKMETEFQKDMSKDLKYLAYYGSRDDEAHSQFVDNFLTILRYVCKEENVTNREEKFKTLQAIFNKYLMAFQVTSDSYDEDNVIRYSTYKVCVPEGVKIPDSVASRVAKVRDKILELRQTRKEQEEIKETSVKEICEQLDEFSL